MASSGRVRGRLHVSKNRKKSWRKYSDIKDIEKFLEEKRREERTGGCVADKTDGQLFFSDTNKTPVKQKRSREKDISNLRCHSSVCYSSIPPPVNPNQVVGKKLKTRRSAIQTRKLKNILQNLQNSRKVQKDKNTSLNGTFHDLWGEDNDKEVDPEIKELVDYQDEITRKKPVKVPDHLYQKPSLLPPVEVPHPGASYNPSFEDHQDLLREAVMVEEKLVKEELHLKRILTDMFPIKSEAPTESTWISEMSQGLFDEAEEGNDEEGGISSSCLTMNPPVTTESQKSKSRKKKEKLRKEEAQKRTLEKHIKHEMNKVFRVRGIISEIKQKELLSEKKQRKKEEESIEKLYKPRTLGQYKYEPNDIEVNLSEELVGTLRQLKVEGNILEDRYKSLQRRNIIEPRIKQKRKRKYKLKVQVKRSHRDFE